MLGRYIVLDARVPLTLAVIAPANALYPSSSVPGPPPDQMFFGLEESQPKWLEHIAPSGHHSLTQSHIVTDRSEVVDEHHESTVWSTCRLYGVGWVRGRPFLHCNSGTETATRKNPWGVLPNMAKWQYAPPASVLRACLP